MPPEPPSRCSVFGSLTPAQFRGADNFACPRGYQPATRPRLFFNERNAISPRTINGSEISDGTPTVALASTKTMTAAIVSNPKAATTHGLRVLTPRFYTRTYDFEGDAQMPESAGSRDRRTDQSGSRPGGRDKGCNPGILRNCRVRRLVCPENGSTDLLPLGLAAVAGVPYRFSLSRETSMDCGASGANLTFECV